MTTTLETTSSQTATIIGKANDIADAFRRVILPFGSDALFDPLTFTIGDSTTTPNSIGIHVSAQSRLKEISLMHGTLTLPVSGGGQFHINTVEFLKYLKLYGNNDVSIRLGDGMLRIDGAKRTVSDHMLREGSGVKENTLTERNSFTVFKTGAATTTRVHTTVDTLNEILGDAKAVGARSYVLRAGPNRTPEITMGDIADPKSRFVTTQFEGLVEGTESTTAVGLAFATLLNNLEGEVELQFGNGTPLVVRNNGMTYVVAKQGV